MPSSYVDECLFTQKAVHVEGKPISVLSHSDLNAIKSRALAGDGLSTSQLVHSKRLQAHQTTKKRVTESWPNTLEGRRRAKEAERQAKKDAEEAALRALDEEARLHREAEKKAILDHAAQSYFNNNEEIKSFHSKAVQLCIQQDLQRQINIKKQQEDEERKRDELYHSSLISSLEISKTREINEKTKEEIKKRDLYDTLSSQVESERARLTRQRDDEFKFDQELIARNKKARELELKREEEKKLKLRQITKNDNDLYLSKKIEAQNQARDEAQKAEEERKLRQDQNEEIGRCISELQEEKLRKKRQAKDQIHENLTQNLINLNQIAEQRLTVQEKVVKDRQDRDLAIEQEKRSKLMREVDESRQRQLKIKNDRLLRQKEQDKLIAQHTVSNVALLEEERKKEEEAQKRKEIELATYQRQQATRSRQKSHGDSYIVSSSENFSEYFDTVIDDLKGKGLNTTSLDRSFGSASRLKNTRHLKTNVVIL
ncbi:hypothetical protein RCL1_007217 [Eukaryota sp. TZLM3-RCL]